MGVYYQYIVRTTFHALTRHQVTVSQVLTKPQLTSQPFLKDWLHELSLVKIKCKEIVQGMRKEDIQNSVQSHEH